MCGICGYVGPEDPATVVRMRDTMTHRGPDDAGLFHDRQVGLGHRRLAIIDLDNGAQPMSSPDGMTVAVFNGEIYNFRELRNRLARLGYEFRTQSDTEVILQAYAAFGVRCVEHLDGMFSLVVYDRRRRRLVGARDRLGKKPLFYTVCPFGHGRDRVSFAFASELKALRAHPVIAGELRLSEAALVSYLLNDYVLGEQRIYEGVRSLEAGGAFEYGLAGSDQPGLRVWKYWDLAFDRAAALRTASAEPPADIRRRVLQLLREAVQKRLVADVPVGALLSGGIDSSAVVALMREFKPADRIETFSIGFDETSFDESEHARAVARHLGVRHFLRRFTADAMLQRTARTIELLDEPFADPSILPVSMLCEFARERVTVALAGDGGDELFAGYDPFRAVRAADWYRSCVPDWLHRRVFRPAAGWLPASSRNMSLHFKLSRFLRGAHADPRLRCATWMGAMDLDQVARLAPDLAGRWPVDRAYAPILAAHDRLEAMDADSVDQALHFFQRFYLTDDILVKVDRASMMHSLEVRSPFLDTALVEYLNSLPHRWKLRRGVTKYLLKEALRYGDGRGALVPEAVITRRKKGFGIPVARWIRHEQRAAFREALVDAWPETLLPMFDRQAVRQMLDAHVRGRDNHYKELWALFVLAHWSQRHLTPESEVALRRPTTAELAVPGTV